MRPKASPETWSTPTTRRVVSRHNPKLTEMSLLINMSSGKFYPLNKDKNLLPIIFGGGSLDFLCSNLPLGP